MAKQLKDLPVGTLVKDTTTTMFGEPIIWRIVGRNHEGYPNNSTTLITEYLIDEKAMDAAEPDNPMVTEGGWNKYSVSNIHQWLNSDAEAGQWYVPAHPYDVAPVYENQPGFLSTFSEFFKKALLETTVIAKKPYGESVEEYETVQSKVFIPSASELGIIKNNIIEGSPLEYFIDKNSRKTIISLSYLNSLGYSQSWVDSMTNRYWSYPVRTPNIGQATSQADNNRIWQLSGEGNIDGSILVTSKLYLRPVCNIKSTLYVSSSPDTDGAYILAPHKKIYIYKPDPNTYLVTSEDEYLYTEDGLMLATADEIE